METKTFDTVIGTHTSKTILALQDLNAYMEHNNVVDEKESITLYRKCIGKCFVDFLKDLKAETLKENNIIIPGR